MIEPLESRIAPAAVLTLTDVDGDIVTISTSKGTNAQLDFAVQTSASGNLGGFAINTIDLSSNAIFDGTNLSVIAKRGPLGGDGLVNVYGIDARNDANSTDTALNLGTIVIDGDLGSLDAGKNTPGSMVKSITVQSTSGVGVWDIAANIGSLTVKGDLRGVEIELPGTFGIGAVKIGGSLIGESGSKTGYIGLVNGSIGSLTIGHDVQGGGGSFSGSVAVRDLGPLTVGGSIIGGLGTSSALFETYTLGDVKIAGDVRGLGQDSATLYALAGMGNVTIGGDLAGGSGARSGVIGSGSMNLNPGKIGIVKIGGSVLGSAINSGVIRTYGDLGALKIKHDLVGGPGDSSGLMEVRGKSGAVVIGGSVLGGAGDASGSLFGVKRIASLAVGGDLRGGTGTYAGAIILGQPPEGGIPQAATIGAVTVRGSIIGVSPSKPARIIIEGNHDINEASPDVLKSLTVGGRVENAIIGSEDSNGRIGAVKVRGDWVASTLAIGITAGNDARLGTADDEPGSDNMPAVVSRIASITIMGQVRGSAVLSDHFGFIAQRIGSFSVAGTNFGLKPGASNDNVSLNGLNYEVGVTGDVTVREV